MGAQTVIWAGVLMFCMSRKRIQIHWLGIKLRIF